MRTVAAGFTLCFVLSICVLDAAGADPGQNSAGAAALGKPRPVLHLRLQGDLDAARLADDFAHKVAESREQGSAPLLLLEIDGRKWRNDVVLAIAKVIRSEQAPITTAVYLNSPTHGVGTGQAAIGLIADACYVSPRTKIVFDPADELRSLAPEGLDADATDRELRGLAWTALQDRRGDALLTTIIPRPTSALYAIRMPAADDDSRRFTLKLIAAPPTAGDYSTLVPPIAEKGPGHVELDTETACRIGFVDGIAHSAAEVLTKQSIRTGRKTEATLRSGLVAAKSALDRYVREIDESRRLAGAAIDEVYRLRSNDSVPRQRHVGETQSPLIDAAKRRLEEAEQLAAEYPELLRSPPPGATGIAQTQATVQKAWREMFQTRRVDLEKLSDKARTLAEKQHAQP